MFMGVAIPAVVVGVIAWFYLPDRPADAKWLTPEEQTWLTREIEAEASTKVAHAGHANIGAAFKSGRVWTLALIYFGFIYGLYALTFFLPTIISGFQEQFGTTFTVIQKGLITAIPYLPAALVLFLWSRDASRRGVQTWHIAFPAFMGAISIPAALYMNSPALTVAVITVTACSIFAALPVFWTVPSRFLTGAAAAAGIALINTMGNIAGFAAGYATGWLKDRTGDYYVPMFIVGGLMLLSAVLMVAISSKTHVRDFGPVRHDDDVAPLEA
jgi:nitrate/nitrite transporter NarK